MSELDVAAWTRQQVEARLELARHAGGGRWETGCTCTGGCHGFPPCDEVTGDDIHIYPEGGHDADQAAHIAANDPQDTIARCEAELAILDEHARLPWFPDETLTAWRSAGIPEKRIADAAEKVSCARCHTLVDAREDEDRCVSPAWPCRTVRLLASGYRHRPGYQEAWKPDKQR